MDVRQWMNPLHFEFHLESRGDIRRSSGPRAGCGVMWKMMIDVARLGDRPVSQRTAAGSASVRRVEQRVELSAIPW
jgi:hypothetical protein